MQTDEVFEWEWVDCKDHTGKVSSVALNLHHLSTGRRWEHEVSMPITASNRLPTLQACKTRCLEQLKNEGHGED